jgi:GNAT superfamily N-acetyltransferase
MSMQARVLPPAEWGRLEGLDMAQLAAAGDPGSVLVLVVESEGQIVGTWAFVQMLHLEGIWIHPDHRKKGCVGRALLRQMRQTGAELGAMRVETGADSPEVERLLEAAGAVPRPYTPYVLPILPAGVLERCGKAFHAQLEAFPAHQTHADDPEHDRAVGWLLLAPEAETAVSRYNAWAAAHGYQLVEGVDPLEDGGYIVRFATEQIRVDKDRRPVEVLRCQ